MPVPEPLQRAVDRYDPDVFHLERDRARIRVDDAWDVLLRRDGRAEIVQANGKRPDATISGDLLGGMDAFRAGRLRIRQDLHLGIGFLAATSGARVRFRRVAGMSTLQAGPEDAPPIVLVHGLGASKASFLPTVGALADRHRVIAIDLPGFGDSDKPLLAPYHAPFFAGEVVRLLDALGLERASVVGNSMGGRVALELGMRHPQRVDRLVLLAPSLAWLRDRPWAPLLRLVPPKLGALQPAPRFVVDRIVRQAIGAAELDHWTAAGMDEFLRAYYQPGGRAAFYSAARNIYLEEPHGKKGFWTRLRDLRAPSLFVWGRQDTLVPIGFARHVREVLPDAQHLELPCGHVPQLEMPRRTHDAMRRFLG